MQELRPESYAIDCIAEYRRLRSVRCRYIQLQERVLDRIWRTICDTAQMDRNRRVSGPDIRGVVYLGCSGCLRDMSEPVELDQSRAAYNFDVSSYVNINLAWV
jgi:hypothetical protein